MNLTINQPKRSARPRVAGADRAFPWYIGAALAVAVGGGFVLALLLPLAVVLEWGWGVRWRTLVQVHGHLQVAGWLGLFIAGMALRLAPRFAGRPLRLAAATPVALALLLTGLVCRTVAQPWLDAPGMRGLLLAGATAELAGALLVAVMVGGTLLPVARTLPAAPLLLLGITGLVAQAALGAVWLMDLDATSPSLQPDRDGTLLAIQFYAFVLPFVLGVSLRALPTFFGRPKSTTPASVFNAWLAAGGLLLGTGLYAGARLLGADAADVRAEQAGAILIALTTAFVIVQLGVWRAPEGLRPSAQSAVLLIRTAYAWLTVAILWLALVAMQALRSGEPPAPAHGDAVRHILALGVFTTLLVGMAQLMLPWLAMRRATAARLRRDAWILWALLTAATLLRVLGAVMELQGYGVERYRVIAAAGVLAITALIFFATTIIRATRIRTAEISLIVHER